MIPDPKQFTIRSLEALQVLKFLRLMNQIRLILKLSIEYLLLPYFSLTLASHTTAVHSCLKLYSCFKPINLKAIQFHLKVISLYFPVH